MKRASLALAAFTFFSGVLSASDPNGSPRYETYYDRVAGARRAVRSMQPGMAHDEVLKLLERHAFLPCGGGGNLRHWTGWCYVERGYLLIVSFETDHGLTSATLKRGDEIVEQVEK